MLSDSRRGHDGRASAASIASALFATELGTAWSAPAPGLAFAAGAVRHHAVAVFDMDWTLVRPTSRRRFPAEPGDWTWCHDGTRTVERLRALHDTHDLVVLTNQSRCSSLARARIERVRRALEIALGTETGGAAAFAVATASTHHRKPMLGAWEHVLAWRARAGMPVDAARSFFCGDAAGRADDFSACDALFARNAGLTFHLPECVFAGARAGSCEAHGCTDAIAALAAPAPSVTTETKTATTTTLELIERWRRRPGEQEHRTVADPVEGDSAGAASSTPAIVVLVGYPASGKSFLAERLGHPVVRDTAARTQSGMLRLIDEALDGGARAVVCDGVHATLARRAALVAHARARGARAVCVHVATPLDRCRHLDYVRVAAAKDGSRELVPTAAFNRIRHKMEPPSDDEGFDALHVVTNPVVLAGAEQRRLHGMRYF